MSVLALSLLLPLLPSADASLGYYRHPAIRGNDVVFTAEGDLWRVPVTGGLARRLTSHPGPETHAAISVDGKWVAFSAAYEGPTEVYVMPIDGGPPKRLTYHGMRSQVAGWTRSGEVLYRTGAYATLPAAQLVRVHPDTGVRTRIPLYQAWDGEYGEDGTLFFTRLHRQGSMNKRYRGGTAQNIWRFREGDAEATPLTADLSSESHTPMLFDGRVYFVSEEKDARNLWSMTTDGKDRKQLTLHKGWDVKTPAMDGSRIVYQLGADLRILDVSKNEDRPLAIRLVSDFDQTRERWVKKPLDYLTHASLSPDGKRVALTARGMVFVVPTKAEHGRRVEVTPTTGARQRRAKFFGDGKSLLSLSDESGELEFWRLDAAGKAPREKLTKNHKGYFTGGELSPDGKQLAYQDRTRQLWVYDLAAKTRRRVAVGRTTGFSGMAWSPDSRWLAYATAADNELSQIHLYELRTKRSFAATSDRVDSSSPAWSPDGKWLYFLSSRNLQTAVPHPWGLRQPEPYYNNTDKVYLLPLVRGLRSPFVADDELNDEKKKSEKNKDEKKKDEKKSEEPPRVTIDFGGILDRTIGTPVPPGNYSELTVLKERLYLMSRPTPHSRKGASVISFPIGNDRTKKKATFAEKITGYQVSRDGKSVLVVGEDKSLHVVPAKETAPKKLAPHKVDLKGFTFPITPREEWRQIFVEAWRLERDWFYDPNLHGVDWDAILQRYLPLVDRVTDRAELSDLIAQMVAELAALHTFVSRGDHRRGRDDIQVASLGAVLTPGPAGHTIDRIYLHDLDYPERAGPLMQPGVEVEEGDVITHVDGRSLVGVPDIGQRLRQRIGQQVRLTIKSKKGTRDVIVRPIHARAAQDLRYGDWELSRRSMVETRGKGKVGYVHLRSMRGRDFDQWAREFYPVFNRQGLIIDVRHNRGGNIDSWILEKLLRKAWFYWQPSTGAPSWNMQFAFRGHIVVLINESTASDGEAFAEGFRRLGLGKIIGTRTWGGEIWLTFSNWLVDKGIASAAEFGVYGPEGTWLIEGHGVDPDMVVDNLPHATFGGKDTQLDAGIDHLLQLIAKDPRPVHVTPKYPNKAQ